MAIGLGLGAVGTYLLAKENKDKIKDIAIDVGLHSKTLKAGAIATSAMVGGPGAALIAYLASIHTPGSSGLNTVEKIQNAYRATKNAPYKAKKNINKLIDSAHTWMEDETGKKQYYYQKQSKEAQKQIDELNKLSKLFKEATDESKKLKLKKQISDLERQTKATLIQVSAKKKEYEKSRLSEIEIEIQKQRMTQISKETVKELAELKNKMKDENISPEEKEVISKEIRTIEEDIKSKRANPELEQERTAIVTKFTNEIKQKLDAKRDEYMDETNVEYKKQLAKEILELEAEKEKNEPISMATASSMRSIFAYKSFKLSTTFSHKEYAKLVKDYLDTKLSLVNKFSDLDKEVDKLQFDMDVVKKALHDMKYLTGGGSGEGVSDIAEGFLSKIIKGLADKTLIKTMFKEFLRPLGSMLKRMWGTTAGKVTLATMGFSILADWFLGQSKEEEQESLFLEDQKERTYDDVNLQRAQYNISNSFLKDTRQGAYDAVEAGQTISNVLSNIQHPDWSKATSISKMYNMDENYNNGKRIGLFGINIEDPLTMKAIQELTKGNIRKIDTTDKKKVIQYLSIGENNSAVFSHLITHEYKSIDDYMDKQYPVGSEQRNWINGAIEINKQSLATEMANREAKDATRPLSQKVWNPIARAFGYTRIDDAPEANVWSFNMTIKQSNRTISIKPKDSSVDTVNLNPELKTAFFGAISELSQKYPTSNISVVITNGYRSPAELNNTQNDKDKQIKEKGKADSPVGHKGTDSHEYGLALDGKISIGKSEYIHFGVFFKSPDNKPILDHNNLETVAGDPYHIQLKGKDAIIRRYIQDFAARHEGIPGLGLESYGKIAKSGGKFEETNIAMATANEFYSNTQPRNSYETKVKKSKELVEKTTKGQTRISKESPFWYQQFTGQKYVQDMPKEANQLDDIQQQVEALKKEVNNLKQSTTKEKQPIKNNKVIAGQTTHGKNINHHKAGTM